MTLDALSATYGSILRKIDLKNDSSDQIIPELHLVVEPSSLKAMVSNLPHSAKAQYYKARLRYPDGKWRRVKYRLRGRNIWHWHENKPSLRIKTRKVNPVSLHRHLNLINPEDITMLANPYGEALARMFGVLAPNTEMVKLYINKKLKGVYQLTNREDESFLRFNRRFPGPLYVGNHLNKIWKAEDFELEGDLDVLELHNPMQKLTELLSQESSVEQIESLWRIVDKDKLASWAALMTVIAGTHSDYLHNQVFYFDPTTGKFEPVVTDILALGALLYPGTKDRLLGKVEPSFDIPIHERMTPILASALADPDFVNLKNKKTYTALTTFASAKAQTRLLEKMSNQIKSSILSDPNKAALQKTMAGWYRIPYGNKQYHDTMKYSREFIRLRSKYVLSELSKSNVYFSVSNNNSEKIEFTIEASGHSPVRFLTKNLFDKFPLYKISPKGEAIVITNDLLLYPELFREKPELINKNVTGRRSPEYTLIPGPKAYKFITNQAGIEFIQTHVSELFKNEVTKGAVKLLTEKEIGVHDQPHTLTTTSELDKQIHDIVLGPGKIILNDNLFIPSNSSLTINPGTNIFMGKNTSIISRGPVIAEGSEQSPILIKRLEDDKPWGVFAIVGEHASGSKLVHLSASGGSTAFHQNIQFSGMFSIHHLSSIAMRTVTFSENTAGDDTLHIIHSHAKIDGINVHTCLSDCIDFDFVEGQVDNINIRDAGNDGIDFMSSKVDITNYKIINCGDKGISLGELSSISGNEISITGCSIGVAAKDKSLGVFEDINITDSNTGITNYAKNWRYGGAGKIISKPLFSGNMNNYLVEEVKSNDTGIYPTSIW